MTVSRSLKAFVACSLTLAVVGCGGAEKPAPPSAVPPAGSGSGTGGVNADPAAKLPKAEAKPAEAPKADAKPAEAAKAPEAPKADAKPAEAPKAPELKKPS